MDKYNFTLDKFKYEVFCGSYGWKLGRTKNGPATYEEIPSSKIPKIAGLIASAWYQGVLDGKNKGRERIMFND